MATIASGTSAYVTFTDLSYRFDVRPLDELLTDSGVALSPQAAAISATLAAILQEASGVLEAAATVGQRYIIGASAPPVLPYAPSVATATIGGTVLAGTYQIVVTTLNQYGESLPSPAASIVTTGTTSTITVTSPLGGIAQTTGYNVYATQVNGTVFTLQNTAPTVIGTNFTLIAPPTSTGANPPTTLTYQNDLMTIAQSGTNTAQFLKGIVCAIAYAFIWDRRPDWIGGDPERAGFRVKVAMEHLDRLAKGAWVFGVIETMQAGILNDVVEDEQVLLQQRRITKVAKPLFGPRVSDYVGEDPPPHPYP